MTGFFPFIILLMTVLIRSETGVVLYPFSDTESLFTQDQESDGIIFDPDSDETVVFREFVDDEKRKKWMEQRDSYYFWEDVKIYTTMTFIYVLVGIPLFYLLRLRYRYGLYLDEISKKKQNRLNK